MKQKLEYSYSLENTQMRIGKPGIKEKSIRRFAMDQSSNILLNRINRYIWTNEKQRQNLDYFNNSYPRSTDAERRSEKPQNDKKHLLEYSNSSQNTAIHRKKNWEKPRNDKKHSLEYSNSFQNTAIH